MNMTLTLSLTTPEAIELVAFVSVNLDDLKPGAPISFLRSIENKLREQVTEQCTPDELMEACKDLEIMSLMGVTG